MMAVIINMKDSNSFSSVYISEEMKWFCDLCNSNSDFSEPTDLALSILRWVSIPCFAWIIKKKKIQQGTIFLLRNKYYFSFKGGVHQFCDCVFDGLILDTISFIFFQIKGTDRWKIIVLVNI